MAQSSHEWLAKGLEEFSSRLERKIHEFKTRGTFSSVHESVEGEIRKRQAELSSRVDEAIRDGTNWDLIKTELTRDYNSLFDTLLRWEEQVEAESMKKE